MFAELDSDILTINQDIKQPFYKLLFDLKLTSAYILQIISIAPVGLLEASFSQPTPSQFSV